MPQWKVPHSHAQRSQNSPEDETVVDISKCDGEVEPIVRTVKGGSLDDRLIAPVEQLVEDLGRSLTTHSFSLTASLSNFESLFFISKRFDNLKLLRTLPHLGSR